MRLSRSHVLSLALCATASWGITFDAQAVRAQCVDHDVTAVILFDGLDVYATLAPTILHVFSVLENTSPSEAELLDRVEATFGYNSYFRFSYVMSLLHYHLYCATPSDLGATAIIDSRNGEIVFAGTVTWLGQGSVLIPSGTHPVLETTGEMAAPPSEIATFPNDYWWGDPWDSVEVLTSDALAILRQTDVLRSFARCSSYSAFGFAYTPSVGATDPRVAKLVMIISGRADVEWAQVAVDQQTWGRIKGLYR